MRAVYTVCCRGNKIELLGVSFVSIKGEDKIKRLRKKYNKGGINCKFSEKVILGDFIFLANINISNAVCYSLYKQCHSN